MFNLIYGWYIMFRIRRICRKTRRLETILMKRLQPGRAVLGIERYSWDGTGNVYGIKKNASQLVNFD